MRLVLLIRLVLPVRVAAILLRVLRRVRILPVGTAALVSAVRILLRAALVSAVRILRHAALRRGVLLCRGRICAALLRCEIRVLDRRVRCGILHRSAVCRTVGGCRGVRGSCGVRVFRGTRGRRVLGIVIHRRHVLPRAVIGHVLILILVPIVVFIKIFHGTIPSRKEPPDPFDRFSSSFRPLILCAYSILPQCDSHMKPPGNFVEER